MKKIRINGVGCCLLDFLYSRVDFNSKAFQTLSSKKRGDGGLSPGKLVFMSDLENFSGLEGSEIIKRLTRNRSYDTVNIGGPSIVSLIHAAQLLCDQAEVIYIGTIGKDHAGNIIRNALVELPLNVLLHVSERPTPATHVLSDANYEDGRGERTFINTIGAAMDMESEMLNDNFYNADICALGGTALVPKIHDQLDNILSRAKKAGALTLVNTVYDFRNEQKAPDEPWPLVHDPGSYSLIDILLMDREEAIRISGCDSAEDMVKFFQDSGVGSYIITNGPYPVYYYSGSSLFSRKTSGTLPVSELLHDELRNQKSTIADTTGCGDNFTGGIIASMAWQIKAGKNKKLDILEAAAWGVVSGGFAGFYLGGCYKEEAPGEKFEKIQPYFDAYIEQTGLLINDKDTTQ